MPGRTRVPRPTVDRLSLYLRELERLETQDRGTVSSRQLGTAAGAAEAQVRKDLGIIGHAGQAGVGYSVPLLAEAIRQVIGVHRQWRAALVGAGNVGRALAAYRRFREEGFEIVAIFDEDVAVVGRTVAGMEVPEFSKNLLGKKRDFLNTSGYSHDGRLPGYLVEFSIALAERPEAAAMETWVAYTERKFPTRDEPRTEHK